MPASKLTEGQRRRFRHSLVAHSAALAAGVKRQRIGLAGQGLGARLAAVGNFGQIAGFPMQEATRDLDLLQQQAYALGIGVRPASDAVTSSGGVGRTRVNAAGLIASASAPRFNYDPVTLAPLGLLSEPQATNLLIRSGELDLSWTQVETTVTANATMGPDGATSAEKLIPSVNNVSSHGLTQAVSFTSGLAYTYSGYGKPAEYSHFKWLFNATSFSGQPMVNFNVSTGVSNIITAGVTALIENAGNGWWRCSGTATATGTASSLVVNRYSNVSTNAATTGDGTSGLYGWGYQVEATSYATSYIPTTSAQVTATADSNTCDVTPWIDAGGGTWRVEFTPAALPGSEVYWGVSASGDSNNAVYLSNSGGNLTLSVVVGGVTASASLGALAAGTRYVVALCLDEPGAAYARVNGSAETALTLANGLPAGLASEGLGRAPWSNTGQGVVHLRRVTYWKPTRSRRVLLKRLSES